MKKRNDIHLKACIVLVIIAFAFQLTGCNNKSKPSGQNIPDSPQHQEQANLPQMLEFTWSAGPAMPQGLQDNAVQILDNWIISVGGFCGGYDDDWKPGIYPRGFLNKVWGLNLDDVAAGWVSLPPLPSASRQGMEGIVVDSKFYVWGGFSYTKPFTYKDGYRLSLKDGEWIWEAMPSLPWSVSWAGAYTIGSKIYMLGGADYDRDRFYGETDRTGDVKNLGSRLIVLDTRKLDLGWNELTPCPGSPRFLTTSVVIDGKFYAIGGVTYSDSGTVCNVVDSWRYDPKIDTWERLRDFPMSGTGSSLGLPVYKNRYILLPAAYQYGNYMKPDRSILPKYGKSSRIGRTWEHHPKVKGKIYYNHIYVYDVLTNQYGTANNLPYDDVKPPTIVLGDSLYMFPNETGSFMWEGEYFGHHPEFVLKGKIKEVDWE